MKFLNLHSKNSKKKETIVDFYQSSINKLGKQQIKKMVERGLSMPVVSL